MFPTGRDMLLGLVLPALVSAVALAAAWRPWRRYSPMRGGYWAGSLALGGGFAAGYVGWFGWPAFPPVESIHWLFVFTLALVVAGLADALWQAPAWLRWSTGLAGSAVLAWLLLRPILRQDWSVLEASATVAGLALAVLVAWLALDRHAEVERGFATPLILLIVSGVSSMVLLLSASQKLGQLGGTLTAALFASVLVAWWSGKLSLARGGVLVCVAVLAGLLICGHFYAELTALNAVLLFAALPVVRIAELPVVRNLPRWQRIGAEVLLVLVPAGTALARAAVSFARALEQQPGGYGY